MTVHSKKHTALDWQRARERLSRAAAALEEAHRLTPERAREILEERARAVARVPAEALAADALIEVVRFGLADEKYAIETDCVREILRVKEITPLPGTPDFLVGITNVRGQILGVFDLRRYFGIPAPDGTDRSRVIVLGRERVEFGVLVDFVDEIALLRIDALKEPPGSVAGIAREYVRGVTADALIVLDGAVLINDSRLYIDLGDEGGPAGSLEAKP
jgi:purine-binding chemotaxis protein CheW